MTEYEIKIELGKLKSTLRKIKKTDETLLKGKALKKFLTRKAVVEAAIAVCEEELRTGYSFIPS